MTLPASKLLACIYSCTAKAKDQCKFQLWYWKVHLCFTAHLSAEVVMPFNQHGSLYTFRMILENTERSTSAANSRPFALLDTWPFVAAAQVCGLRRWVLMKTPRLVRCRVLAEVNSLGTFAVCWTVFLRVLFLCHASPTSCHLRWLGTFASIMHSLETP